MAVSKMSTREGRAIAHWYQFRYQSLACACWRSRAFLVQQDDLSVESCLSLDWCWLFDGDRRRALRELSCCNNGVFRILVPLDLLRDSRRVAAFKFERSFLPSR